MADDQKTEEAEQNVISAPKIYSEEVAQAEDEQDNFEEDYWILAEIEVPENLAFLERDLNL